MKTTIAALKTQLAAEIERGQAAIDALAVIETRARIFSERAADPASAAALVNIAALAAKGLGR